MRAGKAPSPPEVVFLLSIQPMTERRETGAIHLAGPAVAGPWEYSLYRGSIDASGQENWYLRSELTRVPPTPPTPPHQHRLFHPSNQSRTQHLITDQKCSFMLQYFRWEPFMAGS
ncbi:autotransporter outer membrane beta-barrel domain-containing protein [Brucellaceae bacterium VT-16-1752]|nr:autotransporter outer membrane beta-barrel domain-containing protein [Brucellaceae bacterium VT-16-1752]